MELINKIDGLAAGYAESIRTDFLTLFFKAITYIGEWSFVLGILVLISIFFILKKTSRLRLAARRSLDVFILWLVTIGGLGTAFILKEIFHRSRPINAFIAETSSSFPSAHATVSIVFYAFIFYLLAKNTGKNFEKFLFVSAMLIIPLFLGFSRVYLGVHYLSDVLAGYVIGVIWFLIGVYLLNKTSRSPLAARRDLDVFNK